MVLFFPYIVIPSQGKHRTDSRFTVLNAAAPPAHKPTASVRALLQKQNWYMRIFSYAPLGVFGDDCLHRRFKADRDAKNVRTCQNDWFCTIPAALSAHLALKLECIMVRELIFHHPFSIFNCVRHQLILLSKNFCMLIISQCNKKSSIECEKEA